MYTMPPTYDVAFSRVGIEIGHSGETRVDHRGVIGREAGAGLACVKAIRNEAKERKIKLQVRSGSQQVYNKKKCVNIMKGMVSKDTCGDTFSVNDSFAKTITRCGIYREINDGKKASQWIMKIHFLKISETISQMTFRYPTSPDTGHQVQPMTSLSVQVLHWSI